ncbi:MAG: ATP-dependent DNA helicase [Gammaproteobacteria bacterium]|nr:MAG: ATP-dependent DNA helicase [Gammaproteobacteria bacterium]
MNSHYVLLDEDGPLARCVPGFVPRAAQQEMAAAVAEAIDREDMLIVEAGTGTGKTFAYLMPALESGKRVIISTGTRHLQDQLFNQDLPVVRNALEIPVQAALLKGRANYLCQHRLEVTVAEGQYRSKQQLHDLELIRVWAGRTHSGDIAGLGEVSEDSALWPRVTSTVENCLGQECGHYQECYVVKARRAAMEADVVVINHHLLFADMLLREEGFGELLPGVDVIIIDEAHQLPDVASRFFGITVSSHQLQELVHDTRAEHLREAGDMADLPEAAQRLEGVIQKSRLAMGRGDRRAPWMEISENREVMEALLELQTLLAELVDWLTLAAERGKGLDSCRQRGKALAERLDLLLEMPAGEYVRWFESRRRSFRLNLTPLDVAPGFSRSLETLPDTWVFTSATLAVSSSFSHFASRLGLEAARTLKLDSPFDYQNNALVYMPAGMPEPGDRHYTRAVVDHARYILEASKGRAFLLFTSHAALQEAAALLEDSIDYPLLVQGTGPRSDLLAKFRKLGNAVLLGTSSFWEGVDVRGSALSCVIIDKLPFASPGDPVLQARIDAMRSQGKNPFIEYQLPSAVIALKQGVGRLIRDIDDRGVLVLCDPRLRSKSYGRVFLDSLPDMRLTQVIDDVHEFYAGVGFTVTQSLDMEHTL